MKITFNISYNKFIPFLGKPQENKKPQKANKAMKPNLKGMAKEEIAFHFQQLQKKAYETYNSLPLAFQVLFDISNGKVGLKQIESVKNSITQSGLIDEKSVEKFFSGKNKTFIEQEKKFIEFLSFYSNLINSPKVGEFDKADIFKLTDQIKDVNTKKLIKELSIQKPSKTITRALIKNMRTMNKKAIEKLFERVSKSEKELDLFFAYLNDIRFQDLRVKFVEKAKDSKEFEVIERLVYQINDKKNPDYNAIKPEVREHINTRYTKFMTQKNKLIKNKKFEYAAAVNGYFQLYPKALLDRIYNSDTQFARLWFIDKLDRIPDKKLQQKYINGFIKKADPEELGELLQQLDLLDEKQKQIVIKHALDTDNELVKRRITMSSRFEKVPAKIQELIKETYLNDKDESVKYDTLRELKTKDINKETLLKLALDSSSIKNLLSSEVKKFEDKEFQKKMVKNLLTKTDDKQNLNYVKIQLLKEGFIPEEKRAEIVEEFKKAILNNSIENMSVYEIPEIINDRQIIEYSIAKTEWNPTDWIISNLYQMKDEKLRGEIIEKIWDNRTFKFRLAYAAEFLDEDKIREIFLPKTDLGKWATQNNIHRIKDPKLKEEVILESITKPYMHSAKLFDEYLKLNPDIKTPIKNYNKIIGHNLSQLNKDNLLKPSDIYRLMDVVLNNNKIKDKGSHLKEKIEEFNKFSNRAVKYHDRFQNGDKTPFSEKQMKSFLKRNSNNILKAISICGLGPVMNKFDQKRISFKNFLENVENIYQEKELVYLLQKAMRTPTKRNNNDPEEYLKLFNIAFGFYYFDKSGISESLNQMIESNLIDTQKLEEDFFRSFLKKARVTGIKDINIEKIKEKFNLDYIYLIPEEMEALNPQYQRILTNLVKVSITDKYEEFINNPKSPIGKTNSQTKKQYLENGLNYNKWLNYKKTYETNLNDGTEVKIKLWDRNPGFDLFQGNYAQTCVALGGGNSHAILDELINTNCQMLVIYADEKPVGKALLFWAKDLETGKNLLVANTLSFNIKYHSEDIINKDNIKLRNACFKYMKQIAKDISSKETQLLLGQSNNYGVYLQDTQLKEKNVKFIGDSISYADGRKAKKLYVEALGDAEGFNNITKVHKNQFYII